MANSQHSENKEYYKAIVTVPMSPHDAREYDGCATVGNAGQRDDSIAIFPKTGLDVLINNNSYEKFAGFALQQPLGFIVPPPLNQESAMSDGPFQIVPNVEFSNSLIHGTTLSSTGFLYPPNCGTISTANIPISSDMNVLLSQTYDILQRDPYVAGSQTGQFPASQNYTDSNCQSSTVVTSGLVFSSNCPIMSSTETFKVPAVLDSSFSPLETSIVDNSVTISPSGFSTLVPYLKEQSDFKTGSANDSVSDLTSSLSETGPFKDSYFVCKTRKVIQQMTTVHNSGSNNVAGPCGCTCRCNQNISKPSKETTSEVFSTINDRNSKNTSFRTEKSIELNYDYPKPYFDTETSKAAEDTKEETSQENAFSSQTFHTTTEVNSTLYILERKKVPLKNKDVRYKRSNSAPVNIPSDEPVYATVNKLSKKFKKLNIKNLENEIKYVPPDAKCDRFNKKDSLEEKEAPNGDLNEKSVAAKTNAVEAADVVSNGGAGNKLVTKSDSFSESSDKNAAAKQSPGAVRKKKKFSIRFKRKSSKNSCNSKISIDQKTDDEKQEKPTNGVSKDKLILDLINSVDSDKLIDASSSPDSPEVKTKYVQQNYCPKHGKLKHNHRHYHKSGCESPKCYREEFSQHRCSMKHKQSSVAHCDSGTKRHLHPSRHYYKQDSYQEMTTSHSERERTNSLSSSGHSGFSLGSKGRSESHSRREGSIPWCGCWGNSCL